MSDTSIELTADQRFALKALDGMQEVVEHEMLIRGDYVTEVVRPDLAEQGAICGGRNVCAVGAYWVGAGETPVYVECYDGDPYGDWRLVGAMIGERDAFLLDRPGLALGFAALNVAASEYIQRHPGLNVEEASFMPLDKHGLLEWLFESRVRRVAQSAWGGRGQPTEYLLGRADLLGIIGRAREIVTGYILHKWEEATP